METVENRVTVRNRCTYDFFSVYASKKLRTFRTLSNENISRENDETKKKKGARISRKSTYPLLNDEKQSMHPRWCFQRHFDGDPFLLLTTLANAIVLTPFHYRSFSRFFSSSPIALVRGSFSKSFSFSPSAIYSCNYGALTRVNRTRKKARACSIEMVLFRYLSRDLFLSPSENRCRVHQLRLYKYQNEG